MKEYYCYGTLIRVIDGDTVLMECDLGRGIFIKKDRFRLSGINCPEKGQPGHENAKAFLGALLQVGETYRVKTTKADKYGRYLAEIYLEDGATANQKMIEAEYAVKYL